MLLELSITGGKIMYQDSYEEILSVEKLLLGDGYHFSNDAKEVIRYWDSTDVVACPGSGKTTVLLAKLKILADKMPFIDGSGVCVLSHTNVAVKQIKEKLSDYSKKLLDYPNYIGTIQSFIDQFITIPHIRRKCNKKDIRFVGNEEYSSYLYEMVTNNRNNHKYQTLKIFLRKKFCAESNSKNDLRSVFSNLKIKEDGLYFKEKKYVGINTTSAEQYLKAKEDLLINAGVLSYDDTYQYVKEAVKNLSSDYTDLFSMRFKFVFIDEYQDCSTDQVSALEKLFDPEKCMVMHFGDPDQAIYSSINSEENKWVPKKGFLSISNSNRFGQEIADKLFFLRTNQQEIISSRGYIGHKPILIIYNDENIHTVIEQYIELLNKNGLNNPNGIYTVIGHIKKPM